MIAEVLNNLDCERQYKIKKAKSLCSEAIKSHTLQQKNIDYTVSGFTTRLCYLSGNTFTVRGVGKGRNLSEIDVSASYEAIEYYLSGYHFRPYSGIIKGSPREISENYYLRLERCQAEIVLQKANMNCSLPWVIYEDIKTKVQHAAPLASIDLSYRSHLFEYDEFNYNNCSLYASSNGLASGASLEESIIHGALEVLERDAYSYFMINTFVLKKQPAIINKQILPPDLVILISKIEKNYCNKIIICQMPSRFGIYAYVATFSNKAFEIQPRGSGASLNAKYAIERAILELVQSYNLMHGNYLANEIHTESMKNNLLLKKIFDFDLNQDITHESQNFIDNSLEIMQLNLIDYLNKLIDLIYHQSSSLLLNIVYTDTNGLTCSRVIIPDAEEFFLATHYLMLTPKNKTDLYITKHDKKFDWQDFTNKEV